MRNLLKHEEYALPDGPLTIQELSAGARRRIQDASKAHPDDPLLMAAIAVHSGCPEFASETPESILDSMPAEMLVGVADAILRLSGIAQSSEAQVEKN